MEKVENFTRTKEKGELEKRIEGLPQEALDFNKQIDDFLNKNKGGRDFYREKIEEMKVFNSEEAKGVKYGERQEELDRRIESFLDDKKMINERRKSDERLEEGRKVIESGSLNLDERAMSWNREIDEFLNENDADSVLGEVLKRKIEKMKFFSQEEIEGINYDERKNDLERVKQDFFNEVDRYEEYKKDMKRLKEGRKIIESGELSLDESAMAWNREIDDFLEKNECDTAFGGVKRKDVEKLKFFSRDEVDAVDYNERRIELEKAKEAVLREMSQIEEDEEEKKRVKEGKINLQRVMSGIEEGYKKDLIKNDEDIFSGPESSRQDDNINNMQNELNQFEAGKDKERVEKEDVLEGFNREVIEFLDKNKPNSEPARMMASDILDLKVGSSDEEVLEARRKRFNILKEDYLRLNSIGGNSNKGVGKGVESLRAAQEAFDNKGVEEEGLGGLEGLISEEDVRREIESGTEEEEGEEARVDIDQKLNLPIGGPVSGQKDIDHILKGADMGVVPEDSPERENLSSRAVEGKEQKKDDLVLGDEVSEKEGMSENIYNTEEMVARLNSDVDLFLKKYEGRYPELMNLKGKIRGIKIEKSQSVSTVFVDEKQKELEGLISEFEQKVEEIKKYESQKVEKSEEGGIHMDELGFEIKDGEKKAEQGVESSRVTMLDMEELEPEEESVEHVDSDKEEELGGKDKEQVINRVEEQLEEGDKKEGFGAKLMRKIGLGSKDKKEGEQKRVEQEVTKKSESEFLVEDIEIERFNKKIDLFIEDNKDHLPEVSELLESISNLKITVDDLEGKEGVSQEDFDEKEFELAKLVRQFTVEMMKLKGQGGEVIEESKDREIGNKEGVTPLDVEEFAKGLNGQIQGFLDGNYFTEGEPLELGRKIEALMIDDFDNLTMGDIKNRNESFEALKKEFYELEESGKYGVLSAKGDRKERLGNLNEFLKEEEKKKEQSKLGEESGEDLIGDEWKREGVDPDTGEGESIEEEKRKEMGESEREVRRRVEEGEIGREIDWTEKAGEVFGSKRFYKKIAKIGLGTAASVGGVKFFRDLAVYLRQDKQIALDRNDLADIMLRVGIKNVDSINEEIEAMDARNKAKHRVAGEKGKIEWESNGVKAVDVLDLTVVEELEDRIEKMKVDDDVKDKLLNELNLILEGEGAKLFDLDQKTTNKTVDVFDTYIKERVSKMQLAKEGVNTACMSTAAAASFVAPIAAPVVAKSAFATRTLTYSFMDAVQRYKKLKKEVPSDQEVGVIKDVLIGSVRETWNDIRLKDKTGKKTNLEKGMDAAKGVGRLLRYASIFGLNITDLNKENLGKLFDSMKGGVENAYSAAKEQISEGVDIGGIGNEDVSSTSEEVESVQGEEVSGAKKKEEGEKGGEDEEAGYMKIRRKSDNVEFSDGEELLLKQTMRMPSSVRAILTESDNYNELRRPNQIQVNNKVLEALRSGEVVDQKRLDEFIDEVKGVVDKKAVESGVFEDFTVEKKEGGKLDFIRDYLNSDESYAALSEEQKRVADDLMEKSMTTPGRIERAEIVKAIEAAKSGHGVEEGSVSGGAEVEALDEVKKSELEGREAPKAEVSDAGKFEVGVLTAKKGESLWKMSERFLRENGKLEGLDNEQKTYLIDAVKDEMKKTVANPDKIAVGDVLGFGDNLKIHQVDGFLREAKALDSANLESIKANNAKLNEFFDKNPKAPRTSDNYENILKGKGDDGVEKIAKVEPKEIPKVEPRKSVEVSVVDKVLTKGEAGEIVEGKAKEMFKWSAGPFEGSRPEEWEEIRSRVASKVLHGDLDEYRILGIDTIESSNAEELQGYLQKASELIGEPRYGERIDDFLNRYEIKVHEVQAELELDEGGGVDPEVEKEAKEVLGKKTDSLYKYKVGFFEGEQSEEWDVIKDRKAEDVINGKFGEHVGNQLDGAEINNREQVQEYLRVAQDLIGAPKGDENVEKYLLRYEEVLADSRAEEIGGVESESGDVEVDKSEEAKGREGRVSYDELREKGLKIRGVEVKGISSKMASRLGELGLTLGNEGKAISFSDGTKISFGSSAEGFEFRDAKDGGVDLVVLHKSGAEEVLHYNGEKWSMGEGGSESEVGESEAENRKEEEIKKRKESGGVEHEIGISGEKPFIGKTRIVGLTDEVKDKMIELGFLVGSDDESFSLRKGGNITLKGLKDVTFEVDDGRLAFLSSKDGGVLNRFVFNGEEWEHDNNFKIDDEVRVESRELRPEDLAGAVDVTDEVMGRGAEVDEEVSADELGRAYTGEGDSYDGMDGVYPSGMPKIFNDFVNEDGLKEGVSDSELIDEVLKMQEKIKQVRADALDLRLPELRSSVLEFENGLKAFRDKFGEDSVKMSGDVEKVYNEAKKYIIE